MKAVVQRVLNASVRVDGEIISSIQKGVCVFIGISRNDTKADLDYIVKKLLKLRLFDNADGKKWSSSVVDKQYEILCVSQFTLYFSLKGNKLDFHNAMPSVHSEPFYNDFLAELRSQYKHELVNDGKFGALMEVSIVNDGPVTVQIESPAPKVDNEQNDNTDTNVNLLWHS